MVFSVFKTINYHSGVKGIDGVLNTVMAGTIMAVVRWNRKR